MLEFPFKDILMHVNLAISDATDTLLSMRGNTAESKKCRDGIPATLSKDSDIGRVVVEVQPEQQTEGGPWRSTRKRNTIVYNS